MCKVLSSKSYGGTILKEYLERDYRSLFLSDDLIHFQVSVKDTDLDIGVCRQSYSENMIGLTRKIAVDVREELEKYINSDQDFKVKLLPHKVSESATKIAKEMADSAKLANVGPMAAVAGAFAEYIGRQLLKYSSEVIIENGGDIYIKTSRKRYAGIFAGESLFSNRIAVEILPEWGSVGICTSSGMVGHSFSFGKADAAVVIANSCALADAAATAVGNTIQKPENVQDAVEFAAKIPGILGAIAIKDDKMAAWGQIKLVPIKK